MKGIKVLREYHNSVTYSEHDWALLKNKRTNAIKLLELFTRGTCFIKSCQLVEWVLITIGIIKMKNINITFNHWPP